MIKTICALAITAMGFSEPLPIKKPEPSKWEVTTYLKSGLSIPMINGWKALQCINLGLGSRVSYENHNLDVSTDYLIHPGYQIVTTDLSYLYGPDWSFGVYAGVGARLGHVIFDDIMSGPACYFHQIIYQCPFTLGWQDRDTNGRLHFIEVKVTTDKFISIASGIGF